RLDRGRRKQGWVCATEVDRLDSRFWNPCCFRDYRLDVLSRGNSLSHRNRKIAVGAATLAKRDVKVEMHDGNLTTLHSKFRIPHSAFVQVSPNTIPGPCRTRPRSSNSVSAPKTSAGLVCAEATSASTCCGSVVIRLHSVSCSPVKSIGGTRGAGVESATPSSRN